MPWCPICKTEYENELLCPDCSVDLMNGNPSDYTIIFSFSNEEATLNIYNHLLEIGFETVQYYYAATKKLYHIICEVSEEADAKLQLIIYIKDELSCELTPTQKVELSRITDSYIADNTSDSPKAYVSAKDKYTDVNSSAISLLVVGFLGLAILLTDILGIYHFPFHGITRILFLGTLGTLFIVFLFMGIVSLRNAGKLAKQIKVEDNIHEKIKDYIMQDLDLTIPDAEFDADITSEEKYLIRVEYITDKVKSAFPEADSAFIDYIVEELYETIYPEA